MKLNQKKNFSEKISTKESWYIFFLILAGFAIAFLLVLYFNNPYIPPHIENAGNTKLGTQLTLLVDDCGSQTKTLSLSGKLLPQMEYTQNVYVSLVPESQNCIARAKIFMYDNSGQKFNLKSTFTNDWEANADGYYYYKNVITPSLVVKCLTSIETPSGNVKIHSGNTYQIFVTIETLPENADVNLLWLK